MAHIDPEDYKSTDGSYTIVDEVLRQLCEEERWNGAIWMLVHRYINELQELNVKEQVELLVPGFSKRLEKDNKRLLDAELN
jgi:hypothetical protein